MVKLNIISEAGNPVGPIWGNPNGGVQDFYQPKDINLETWHVDKFGPPSKLSFIETGTYRGDTFVRMMKHGFVFGRSVELNDDIISEDNMRTIRNMGLDAGIYRGDSPDLIPTFLADLKKKFPDPKDQEAVFWLDAHASGPLAGGRSGGCPLLDELKAIAADPIKTHTIFINDRRLFGTPEWSFVEEGPVIDLLRKINPNYNILLLDGQMLPRDIICATVYTPADEKPVEKPPVGIRIIPQNV
jgi:hypothetical protein